MYEIQLVGATQLVLLSMQKLLHRLLYTAVELLRNSINGIKVNICKSLTARKGEVDTLGGH